MSAPMHRLSKPDLDIGLFTNHLEETLAFWREDIGLSFAQPVYFHRGLVQYHHSFGDTVVKINSADGGVSENIPRWLW